MIVSPIINGYVATIMWRWFVMPQFGLKPLSIPIAIGLRMLANLPRGHQSKKNTDGEPELTELLTIMLLAPFIGLALAWIIHLFV